MTAEASERTNEFWIFGYGSLIWKPPPHFDIRVAGYVEGYVRRFWQVCRTYQVGPGRKLMSRSEDHRGTPEAPGRVLTLIERSHWASLGDTYTVPEDRVWGTAYRIKASKVDEVKDYLDIREINGYSIQYTNFTAVEPLKPPFKCLVYIGMPYNPQFVGVQEPQELAEHIFRSKGPSGENKEYLYMLDAALKELGPESGDSHIEDLVARVRMIGADPVRAEDRAVAKELSRVASGDTAGLAEETEKGG